jgi:hypothetical protein
VRRTAVIKEIVFDVFFDSKGTLSELDEVVRGVMPERGSLTWTLKSGK